MLPVIVRKNSVFRDSPMAQLDRAFSRWADTWFDDFSQSKAAVCPVDISEDDNNFYIEAELPGFTKDEISVTVNEDTLTISASHKAEEENKDEKKNVRTWVSQRKSASVSRSFTLPDTVDTRKIEAENVDGVLKLTLGKTPPPEEPKPVEIKIK